MNNMRLLGLDEVGRGCLAGPLVAGAVILEAPFAGLRDSKKLTKFQRQRLDIQIRTRAIDLGLGWVTPAEVDELGLTAAVRLAMQRALNEITASYEEMIIDGNYNFLAHIPGSRCLIGADDLVPAVSAASILAKVARDAYMVAMDAEYPGYEFAKHVGYGTAAHRAALQTQGACLLHRRSFAPLRLLPGSI